MQRAPFSAGLAMVAGLLASAFLSQGAVAQTADQSATLLTVLAPDGSEIAHFDIEALKALPSASFDTTTIWTEGMQSFTGVPLSALMAEVAPEATKIDATAVNDYSVQIPASDWANDDAILAYERNGAPMSLREKGPLWIVYPYDASSDYRKEIIYARSIWQLDRIRIVD